MFLHCAYFTLSKIFTLLYVELGYDALHYWLGIMRSSSKEGDVLTRKENLAMLMWIASIFVSLFHQSTPIELRLVQPDKPVAVQGVPADQSIIDIILAALRTDGQHFP